MKSTLFFVLQLLQLVYPDLYRVDTLSDEGAIKEEDENGAEILIPQPNRLQLSFEKVSATGKKFREIVYYRPGQLNWKYIMWKFQYYLLFRFYVKSILVFEAPQKVPI